MYSPALPRSLEGPKGEWQRRTKKKAAFVDTMCSTACGAPQLEGSYCARERLATTMSIDRIVLISPYTCVHVVYIHIWIRCVPIILNFCSFAIDCQIVKLKRSPKFPAARYIRSFTQEKFCDLRKRTQDHKVRHVKMWKCITRPPDCPNEVTQKF